MSQAKEWVLPYIDEPPHFWDQVMGLAGGNPAVYFPLPGSPIGTGRPMQAQEHLDAFLRNTIIRKSVLLNPIVLPRPVDEAAPAIIDALSRLESEFGVAEAVVTSPQLAARIRNALPDLTLCASTLTDIASPLQVEMLEGIYDVITPSTRMMRDVDALRRLRAAHAGRIRLMVNECCLPGCPFRTQHFMEMNSDLPHPESLCTALLDEKPWLRLAGAWVLPQHLHLFDGLYDELKLAGRVTLREPEKYQRVLKAYVNRAPLQPHEIGGGPASPLEPIEITEDFYKHTLTCDKDCARCSRCRDYFANISIPGVRQ